MKAVERDEITVLMMSGHTVPIEMESSATILDVKKDLQAKEGVDQAVLKLLFRDQEVTDDQTLEAVSKIAGSNYFALNAHEKVHIDTTMMAGNHVISDLETTHTVLDLKKKLKESEGCEVEVVCIYHGGNEITDDLTFETVKNKAGSNNIELEARERMHLDVLMMSGHHVPLDMETRDCITDVKKKLEEAEGVDWHLLTLLYTTEVLPDEFVLGALQKKAGSNSVSLEAKEKLQVNVKMMDGKDVAMEKVTSDTILDVKKDVSAKQGVAIEKMILLLNDKGL